MKTIKERRINLFKKLIEQLKEIDKQKIIVIDKIQTLENIYINGDRELLKEFLNCQLQPKYAPTKKDLHKNT